MHEELADEYRRSHGLTEEDGFSTGRSYTSSAILHLS